MGGFAFQDPVDDPTPERALIKGGTGALSKCQGAQPVRNYTKAGFRRSARCIDRRTLREGKATTQLSREGQEIISIGFLIGFVFKQTGDVCFLETRQRDGAFTKRSLTAVRSAPVTIQLLWCRLHHIQDEDRRTHDGRRRGAIIPCPTIPTDPKGTGAAT